MPKCVTILPSNCQCDLSTYVNRVAIRTHQATCDSELHFIDHDILTSEGARNSSNIQEEVELLGGKYHHWKEPTNMCLYYNKAADQTDSEFVVFATADIIFYRDWLKVILEDFEEHPHLVSLHPCSFHAKWAPGPTYFRTCADGVGVIELTQPTCHVCVFKRSDLYRWDETLPFHESDTDYFFWLEANGKKAGQSLRSRVDHVGSVIRSCSDPSYITPAHFDNATARLKQKWNR